MGPEITSLGNERVKWLRSLRERRNRDRDGAFLVEGERTYRRALAAGLEPLFTISEFEADWIVGPKALATPAVLDKISYRSTSQGLAAAFTLLDTELDRIQLGASPLVLVAEGIEKPGNLGAMMRTADAVGADAVIVVGDALDIHNPNVVRSSTGAIFTVPVATTDWEELGRWLTDNHLTTHAASPQAETPLWDVDLTHGVAVVIGAEHSGLSPTAKATANAVFAIPHDEVGIADSLNASVTAAVVLFEAARQRHMRRRHGGGSVS